MARLKHTKLKLHGDFLRFLDCVLKPNGNYYIVFDLAFARSLAGPQLNLCRPTIGDMTHANSCSLCLKI